MGYLRKLAERLARGKIIRRNILINGQSVPIYVSPDASLKHLKFGRNAYANNMLIYIAEKHISPDSNVWDIGGNVGIFTFSSAEIARNGVVLCVEADTWLANILRKTASLRKGTSGNVCILPAAVSEKTSVAKFMIASRGRASNALEIAGGRTQMGGVRETQYVPTITLDFLRKHFPDPDFVKIDIEGAELMALQGASEIINDVRPIFFIEIGKQIGEAVLKIFFDADYVAIGQTGRELNDSCESNTFFVPREKYHGASHYAIPPAILD